MMTTTTTTGRMDANKGKESVGKERKKREKDRPRRKETKRKKIIVEKNGIIAQSFLFSFSLQRKK